MSEPTQTNDEKPTCDHPGCNFNAKYKHTYMQGQMEIPRHWCGYHVESTHDLEQISE